MSSVNANIEHINTVERCFWPGLEEVRFATCKVQGEKRTSLYVLNTQKKDVNSGMDNGVYRLSGNGTSMDGGR